MTSVVFVISHRLLPTKMRQRTRRLLPLRRMIDSVGMLGPLPVRTMKSVLLLLTYSFLTITTTIPSAVALTMNGATTSTTSTTRNTFGGWSDVAVETARRLTVSTRKRLQAEGVIGIPRDVYIRGEPVVDASSSVATEQESTTTTSPDPSAVVTKTIHFQRHGQGYHNVICEMWRELGKPVDLDSQDPILNPMKRLEVMDAPLTEIGRQQCLARTAQASQLNPQIVVVSPLLRTLQTAELSFSAHRKNGIPWVAHEKCREDLGVLVCNQRQRTSQIQSVYPKVDFSLLVDEHDVLFLPNRHETSLEKANRVYDFLLYLRDLPQTEIAVVTHSAWLFNMCNAVMDIPDDSLSSWFLTSEIRSMQVSFSSSNTRQER